MGEQGFELRLRSEARQSAADYARQRVAAMINLKEVMPGTRLPSAAELGSRFGVSRPSVLDALKRIEGEGWLEVGPGGAGARVLDPGGPGRELRVAWVWEHREVIAQMARLRLIVEPELVRLAAAHGMGVEAEREVRGLVAAMAETAGRQEVLALDTRLHAAIVAASGQPLLVDLLQTARSWVGPAFDVITWPRSRRHRSGKVGQVEREHEQLVEAVLRRDERRAHAISRRHVAASAKRIEELLVSVEEA